MTGRLALGANSLHALLVLSLLGGCGGMELTSRWRDRGVLIDGKDVNWFSASVPIDGERAAVVVCNDSTYIYVGFRTSNRELGRLVVREGITWWFDREGGEKKRFGVHYPVGAGPTGRLPEEVGERVPSEVEGGEIRRSADELDLYVSGENTSQRMTKMEAAGIDARFRRSRDTLYYELVVPLAESGSHPFAIGTTPGAAIGIGAETARERPHAAAEGGNPERASQPRGGERSGMGGRGGGGRAGREGGTMNRQQGGSPRPDPLNVWAKVHLTGPASPAH